MKKLLLSLIASSLCTLAVAKDDNPEAAACRQDNEKYCVKVEPGEGRQMKCLYDLRDRIAPACAAIIKEKYERYEALNKKKEGR